MSSAPLQPAHRQHSSAPTKFGQMLQTVQGAYYLVAGLAVAFLFPYFRGETAADQYHAGEWGARGVALLAAGVGAALLYSGWFRRGTFVPGGLGMWTALFLLAQGAAGRALGLLPATFLIDTAVEAGFLGLWMVVMFGRVGESVEKSTPLPDRGA